MISRFLHEEFYFAATRHIILQWEIWHIFILQLILCCNISFNLIKVLIKKLIIISIQFCGMLPCIFLDSVIEHVPSRAETQNLFLLE